MNDKARLQLSLILSAALHLLLLGAWTRMRVFEAGYPIPLKSSWVTAEIHRLPPKQNRNLIVETIETKPAREVDKNAYLGAQNQMFDRQTVNPDQAIQMGSSPSLNRLGIRLTDPAQGTRRESDPGDGRYDRFAGADSDAGQVPKYYIQGLKSGPQTALNTRQYMFYGYFQRIRERLDRVWTRNLANDVRLMIASGRHLAREMDYVTDVMLILDSKGVVVRVELRTECGVRALDESAIRALNEAGPFPNPPRGMINERQEVRVPWRFIVKT